MWFIVCESGTECSIIDYFRDTAYLKLWNQTSQYIIFIGNFWMEDIETSFILGFVPKVGFTKIVLLE